MPFGTKCAESKEGGAGKKGGGSKIIKTKTEKKGEVNM